VCKYSCFLHVSTPEQICEDRRDRRPVGVQEAVGGEVKNEHSLGHTIGSTTMVFELE
jgi:hypothetical protein